MKMIVQNIASCNTVQSISLRNELQETIYACGFHQFPQFMQLLMNCTWNGR